MLVVVRSKRIILFCLFSLLLISPWVYGQQSTFWSHSALDDYILNPAAAGFGKSLLAQGIHRNQWNGIGGGLSSQGLMTHLPLYILNGGVGMTIIGDRLGASRRTDVRMSYNYVLGTSLGLVSFGVEAGWLQVSLDGSELRSPDGVYDNGIDHKDDHLPMASSTGGGPQLGLGSYWNNGSWSAGLSWRGLGGEIQLGDQRFIYTQRSTWIVHGSYKGNFNDYDWQIQNVLAHDGTEWQNQASIFFYLPNNIHIGAAFRGYAKTSADAVIMSFGFRLNEHFRLSYALDYLVSGLNQANSNNTHEFALTYNLRRPIRTGLPPRVIYNPRF